MNVYEKLINDSTSVYGLGSLIRIDNSSYTTYDSNNGIFVAPGPKTFITIEREFKSMFPKPYSNFESHFDFKRQVLASLFNLIEKSEYVYSQQLCFSQCLQQYFVQKYNCTLNIFISLFNVSSCDYDLYVNILSWGDLFEINYINDVCVPLCPLECNVIKLYISQL